MSARFSVNKLLFALLAAALLSIPVALRGQSPVVYGVFFYSPTCPHCQDVLTNHWPDIQAEFGDQLHVLFIDVTTPQGGQIMLDAVNAMSIGSTGVPMLIIGSDVLIGSADIPARTSSVVRAGLAAGGVGLPPIPNIDAVFQMADQANPEAAPTASPTATLADRLTADPVANGLAIFLLLLLCASLVTAFFAFWQRRWLLRLQPGALILGAVLGIGLSLSLLAGSTGDPLVVLLAAGELVVFAMIGALSLRGQTLPRWLVPLTAVAGLGVAGYLALVELTLSEAVCGVVGNCNTVQQSMYAQVFGVPVGVLGVVGYVLIAVLWLLGREGQRQVARGLVLIGVAFSIYLTFLEPFVIGATCVWCLTSAVIMLLLLWLLTPAAPDRRVPVSKRA